MSEHTSSTTNMKSSTITSAGSAPYRDYSRVPPSDCDKNASAMGQGGTAKEPTFPVKLHMILSNPEFQDIISWLPHGRSWRILQQKAFEERVIPLYFRHGRYSSFARQVNGWGFRRITHGSDYNSYYHELFLRGLPHLCDKMRRLTSKDISQRKGMEEEAAPDFYALSRDHPLPENNNSLSSSQRKTVESLPSPNAVSSSSVAAPSLASRAQGQQTAATADVELALLERRRAEILERMNSLSAVRGLPAGPPSLGGSGLLNIPKFGAFPSLMGVNPLLNPAAIELDLLRQRRESQLAAADLAKYLHMNDMSLSGASGLSGLSNAALLGRPYGL